MPIVVDASVTISWFFGAERIPSVEDLWDEVSGSGVVVPTIWSYEVANRLGRSLTAGEIPATEVAAFFAMLETLQPVTVQPSLTALVARMTATGLTACDAAYLDVAAARGLALATLDRRLREAAAQAGIAVLPESF
ncbi:type II toxin-antitoxin system VapC family toxin [Microbacterium sp.]|uniref:type II toxin-antitoxin system VapC family toxin n=1 Tax=Microbacterium sp. TaxID=51671 RepID=UPI0039E28FE0